MANETSERKYTLSASYGGLSFSFEGTVPDTHGIYSALMIVKACADDEVKSTIYYLAKSDKKPAEYLTYLRENKCQFLLKVWKMSKDHGKPAKESKKFIISAYNFLKEITTKAEQNAESSYLAMTKEEREAARVSGDGDGEEKEAGVSDDDDDKEEEQEGGSENNDGDGEDGGDVDEEEEGGDDGGGKIKGKRLFQKSKAGEAGAVSDNDITVSYKVTGVEHVGNDKRRQGRNQYNSKDELFFVLLKRDSKKFIILFKGQGTNPITKSIGKTESTLPSGYITGEDLPKEVGHAITFKGFTILRVSKAIFDAAKKVKTPPNKSQPSTRFLNGILDELGLERPGGKDFIIDMVPWRAKLLEEQNGLNLMDELKDAKLQAEQKRKQEQLKTGKFIILQKVEVDDNRDDDEEGGGGTVTNNFGVIPAAPTAGIAATNNNGGENEDEDAAGEEVAGDDAAATLLTPQPGGNAGGDDARNDEEEEVRERANSQSDVEREEGRDGDGGGDVFDDMDDNHHDNDNHHDIDFGTSGDDDDDDDAVVEDVSDRKNEEEGAPRKGEGDGGGGGDRTEVVDDEDNNEAPVRSESENESLKQEVGELKRKIQLAEVEKSRLQEGLRKKEEELVVNAKENESLCDKLQKALQEEGKNEKLEQELGQLQQEMQWKELEVKSMKDQIKNLKDHISTFNDFKDIVSHLKLAEDRDLEMAEASADEKENASLLEELEKELEKAREKAEQFEQENIRLKEENNQLQEANPQLDELRQKLDEALQKAEELKQENTQLVVNNTLLQNSNTHFQQEIQALKRPIGAQWYN